MIDWSNPKEKISKYFTVKESLWLPSWQVYHIPSEEEKENILKIATKMDLVRDFVDMPIIVQCWIRPINVNSPDTIYHGKNYNEFIHGAPASTHILGMAVDWNCALNCDEIRFNLQFQLAAFGIRMERLPGSNWIHNDNKNTTGERYFIP